MTAQASPDSTASVVHALVRLVDGARGEEAYRTLLAQDLVSGGETLRGPWDLLLRGAPGEDLGALGEHELVASAELIGAGEAVVRCESCGKDAARQACLLELEPGAAPVALQTLGELEELERAHLDADSGKLLLVVAGPHYHLIDRLVREELALLPGLRRLTTARLIRLGAEQASDGVLHPLQRDLWCFQPDHGELIPLLQLSQDTYGYLPEAAIELVSGVTGVPIADIYGIITFYAQFRLEPLGRYVIRQCHGTACHVNGAQELLEVMEDRLGISVDQTDEVGDFTLQKVACIGCCSLAPVLTINEDTHGRLDAAKLRRILKTYQREAKANRE